MKIVAKIIPQGLAGCNVRLRSVMKNWGNYQWDKLKRTEYNAIGPKSSRLWFLPRLAYRIRGRSFCVSMDSDLTF